MKKTLNSILAVLLSLVMTASIVASGIADTLDFPPDNNTEITERRDEEKEPDCSPNCDESWLDELDGDY
ncbi:MAG: hypothetical protein LUH23_09550 [Oscillospiraceae bacterium]|nr:hypothetical protein [Oscillospiraceae bacterium]